MRRISYKPTFVQALVLLITFITIIAASISLNSGNGAYAAKPRVGKPSYLKVYRSRTSALLEWEKVDNVTGYKIYRKVVGGKYKYLGKVKQKTYKKVQTDYIQFVDWTHEKDSDYGEDNTYSYKKKYRYKVVAYKTANGKQYYGKKITKTSNKYKKQKVEFGYEMLPLVNELRKERGHKIAVWHHALEDGTVVRAREIADSYSHDRPDGSYYNTAFNYIKSVNLPGCIITGGVLGENINRGYTVGISWETSFYSWCNSGGHWSQFMYDTKDEVAKSEVVLVADDENGLTHELHTKKGDITRTTMGICAAQYQKTKGGSRYYVYEVGSANDTYSVYGKPYEGFLGNDIRDGKYLTESTVVYE